MSKNEGLHDKDRDLTEPHPIEKLPRLRTRLVKLQTSVEAVHKANSFLKLHAAENALNDAIILLAAIVDEIERGRNHA